MNYDQVWQAVLGEVELNISRPHFSTWFKNTFIHSFGDNILVICVPNNFTKDWLQNKFFKEISVAFTNVTKELIKDIQYRIEIKKSAPLFPAAPKPINSHPQPTVYNQSESNFGRQIITNRFGLNNRYTFNNFIVGKGNELAHAACMAVATNPGNAYNPLFIYGGVGLGKTHLIQAIGHDLSHKTDKVLYVTSEKFSSEYVDAVRSGHAKDLKDKYRNVDVFLIDDIQFMGGREGTQEEFFHTFNELYQANKQIVITADKPPKALPALEQRLISRFSAGMIADITMPDIETRIAILENKCHEKNFPLNDKILLYIAQSFTNNIRELEGALIKLVTYYEFNNLQPTLESAKTSLANIITEFKENSLTAKGVLLGVCKFFDIEMKDLLGKSRKKELVGPRQIAMYIIKEEIKSSFPNIGAQIGDRDHTTVMHACKKIENEIKINHQTKQAVESIKQLIYSC